MTLVPSELWGALVGLIGALVGYVLREYQNRIDPFFRIMQIYTVNNRTDPEQLTRSTAERLNGSFYIGDIRPIPEYGHVTTTIGEIHDRWEFANDVRRFWPEIKSSLEQAMLPENSENEYINKLSEVFSYGYFDKFIMNALWEGPIGVPNVADGDEKIRAIFDQSWKNGCFWLSFPGQKWRFGEELNDPAIGAHIIPFVNLIKFVRRDYLDILFREFIKLFDNEFMIATSVADDLKALTDKHSRWALIVYFANLNESPLIVENKIILEISDPSIKTIREECYLLIAERKGDGDEDQYVLRDTMTPLIVEKESSKTFGVLTAKTQVEMKEGSILREVFERGKGKCRVIVTTQKIGLIKRQTVKSTRETFLYTKKARTS